MDISTPLRSEVRMKMSRPPPSLLSRNSFFIYSFARGDFDQALEEGARAREGFQDRARVGPLPPQAAPRRPGAQGDNRRTIREKSRRPV
eukprot:3488838-Pyramimonas_sp.AAC.1